MMIRGYSVIIMVTMIDIDDGDCGINSYQYDEGEFLKS